MTNSLGSLNGPSRTSARTVNAPDRESSTARVAQSCIGDHDRPPHRLDIPEPLLSDSVPGACHCQVQSHGPCPCHCRVQSHGPCPCHCRVQSHGHHLDRNHPLRPELMLQRLRLRGTGSGDWQQGEDYPSSDLQTSQQCRATLVPHSHPRLSLGSDEGFRRRLRF